MTEVGKVSVGVTADTSAAENQIASKLGTAGERGGRTASQRLTSVLKGGALVAGGAMAGILGASLVKGFQRLSAIDQAEAKLRGLGNSAKDVTAIMDNALASVKGTAFGLDEAASQAAVFVAAGIKPGEDLTRTLSLMADTATIAGTSLSSLSDVFGDAAVAGKLTGGIVNRLQTRGIPVLQFLGEQFGVTAAEADKMVSEGKVSFDDFQAAMETGLGGAAKESGNTFSGAMKNVQAALGRIGASLLGGVFEQIPQVLGTAIEKLDAFGPTAEKLGAAIGDVLGTVLPVVVNLASGFLDILVPAVTAAADAFIAVKDFISENETLMRNLGIMIGTVLAPAFIVMAGQAVKAWAMAQIAAIRSAAVQVAALYRTAGAWAMASGRALASGLMVVAAWARAAGAAVISAATQSTAGLRAAASWTAQIVAMGAYRVAQLAAAAASKIMAVAQWALNAALSANPIGLIVLAIAALIAGLVYAYKNFETFRRIVDGAFRAVKVAALAVWNFLKGAWQEIWPSLKATMQNFANAAKSIWDIIKRVFQVALNLIKGYIKAWIAVVKGIWKGLTFLWDVIKRVFTLVVNIVKTYINTWKAIIRAGVSAVKAIWQRVLDIVNIARNAISRVVDAFRDGVGRIRGWAESAVNAVKGVWEGIVGWFSSLGSRAVQALINAMSGLGSRIKSMLPGPLRDLVPFSLAPGAGDQAISRMMAMGGTDGAALLPYGASRASALDAMGETLTMLGNTRPGRARTVNLADLAQRSPIIPVTKVYIGETEVREATTQTYEARSWGQRAALGLR